MVAKILKRKETTKRKLIIHRDSTFIDRKGSYKHRAVVGMLVYLQGSTWTEMLMKVHWCEKFINNHMLMYKYLVRSIAKYLESTLNNMDILDGTCNLSTCKVV